MKPNLDNERFFLRLVKRKKLRVTREGRAFNVITGRELSKVPSATTQYRKLSWQDPKTKKIRQIQLHRLVWCVFKGIPSPGLIVNHKDGHKENCKLSNLEACSVLKNNQHAVAQNLTYYPKGEERSTAVFSDDEVRRYRTAFLKGKVTIKDVARIQPCSYVVAHGMLTKRTYKSI